jgi:hypothetical protein
LSTDQIPPAGLSSEAYGGSWKTVSQSRAVSRSPIARLTRVFRVAPDRHDRAIELLVRGIEQPGVVRCGEARTHVSAEAGSRRPPGRSAAAAAGA